MELKDQKVPELARQLQENIAKLQALRAEVRVLAPRASGAPSFQLACWEI